MNTGGTRVGLGRNTGLLVSTAGMGILAVVLLAMAYTRGGNQHIQGFRSGTRTLMQVLPMLFFAMIAIQTLPLVVPPQVFSNWIGAGSGWRGILAGTVAGGFAPGGPVIQAVIAAGLLKAGAGIGMIVAFLTAGVLWAFAILPIEVSILGWRIVLVRLACTFFFPPIAGAIAHVLFERFARG
jgi:uncharacterized protein